MSDALLVFSEAPMYRSVSRSIKFTEEYSLPGAELKCAVIDKDHGRISDHGRHGMGGRIALQMFVLGAIRNKAFKDGDEIFLYCRIGTFVDGDACRGVGIVQVADA